MPDSLFTAAAPDAGIAAAVGVTTELVSQAQQLHDLAPTAAAALGRLITAAALLGTGLKGRERVSLLISGDGPIGSLDAEAWLIDERTVGVRGHARHPHADLPLNARNKFDVAAAIGNGQLQVTKSFAIGQPYVGVVPLRSGEIAEDVAAYLVHSEQIPSVVALGVLADPKGVRAAGGALAQVLPGADERAVATLEAQALAMPPITTLLASGAAAPDVLRALVGALALRSRRELNVRLACLCTREKVETALLSLGLEELNAMAHDGETEVTCDYCRTRYAFSDREMRALLRRKTT